MALRKFIIERDIPGASSLGREQLRTTAGKSNGVLRESYVPADKTFAFISPRTRRSSKSTRKSRLPGDQDYRSAQDGRPNHRANGVDALTLVASTRGTGWRPRRTHAKGPRCDRRAVGSQDVRRTVLYVEQPHGRWHVGGRPSRARRERPALPSVDPARSTAGRWKSWDG